MKILFPDHRRGKMRVYITKFLRYLAICSLIYLLVLGGILVYFGRGLPPLEQLERIKPKLITTLYSADGQILKRFAEERRELVSYERIPPQLINAVVAVEDERFWEHWGLVPSAIIRAAFANLKAQRIVQGGSTITQQLARNLFLSQRINLTRKIKEALTAVRIERTYSKREIVEMYLNQVYFGHGAWGVQSAARLYFSKDVEDLSPTQCFLLAALLKAPSIYSPIDYPDRALMRRNFVIERMRRVGMISDSQAQEYKESDLELNPRAEMAEEAPYFVEYVRQELERKYGSHILYEDGVSVYTTLNLRLQRVAEQVFQKELARRQQIVDRQKEMTQEDSSLVSPDSLEAVPADTLKKRVVQGALIAIDPSNGHILAMLGGRDFRESKFNRAVQALRQPGSAFKPFVYTAAVDNGYRPTDIILDSAITLPMADGTLWRPENYDRRFLGPITLREALKHSRNVATIHLLMKIGPQEVIKYARMMGISTQLQPVYSLAVGTSDVKLIDITSAYGVFPNHGIRVEPIAILSVVDKDGRIIEEREKGKETEVLRPQTAYVMTSMLRSVIEEGTGQGTWRWYGFKRPAGGKTGTTDNYTDAWFIGFIPQLVTGVWVGFDEKIPLGQEHSSAAAVALPLWAKFMKAASDSLSLPVEDFAMPAGVVRVKVCAETWQKASPYCPKTVEEVFVEGTQPTEICQMHGRKEGPAGPAEEPERGKLKF